MKSKGAVKFFAIALAVVCLFQLSFTFMAKQVESRAKGYANGDPKKERRYLDSVSNETILNLGIHKYTYMDIKEREMNLGLDLKGGMHVTLEVNQGDMLRALSNRPNDSMLNRALNQATQRHITSQKSYVELFDEEIKALAPNTPLATYFISLDNKGKIDRSSDDSKVKQYLKEEANTQLDNTFKILRTRIDKFGVTQPNISKDEVSGRIIVELPGATDVDRVRSLLKRSAKLEFYETWTINELIPFMQEADKAVYSHLVATGELQKKDTAKADGNLLDVKPIDVDTTNMTQAQRDSVKLAQGTDAKKDENQRQPLLEALNLSNDMAGSPFVGQVLVTDTSKVNSYLQLEDVKGVFPAEVKLLWESKPIKGTNIIRLVALKTELEGKPALDGGVIVDARQDVDPTNGGFAVMMQMNAEGATDWAAITKANKGRSVAIVLDNEVYSAPNVNQEISGGNSQITGNFTAEEAADLANVLKAGKLPVELTVIDLAEVGPSLGQDNINKGLASLLVGLLAVIIFMGLYYNRSGWVANLALLVNLFFIIGVLTSLQAALTLPGMAGIVLTLGMAVDANVLIYERIREEIAAQKGMRLAIADGFRHALSSIIDGNLTTLLIGIILMTFGSGPIYGFAVVLVIGILTSLFTAILISRLIFEWLLAKDKKVNFGNKFTNDTLKGINFDFIGKRKIGYIISSVTLIIAIAGLAINNLNYGVDFKGGHAYTVAFEQPVDVNNVKSILASNFGTSPEVKTYGSDSKLNIVTDYLVDDERTDETDAKVKSKLEEGLAQLNNPYKIEQVNIVSSTIANDVKTSALWSIIFGLAVVFIYIVIRFKRWQFAAGATIAIAHDVIFVLSLFAIFKDVLPFTDVNEALVAALLTVVGYSINDTVVVFDRIREYLKNNKKSPMIPTVNAAINTTLSRTVITSFTVFLVVLILFIFGGSAIRGFSFAIMIGVLVGTYSSIFVATPIAVDLQKRSELDSSTL